MRILLYICILALLLLAPVERLDVAKLEPVQTVALRLEGQTLVLETDTKNRGQGSTLREAIEDLENRTPGVIYLDTAQYLLLTEDVLPYSQQLKTVMHPTVKVSLWDGKGSVEKAAQYLAIRRDLPRLKELPTGRERLPKK